MCYRSIFDYILKKKVPGIHEEWTLFSFFFNCFEIIAIFIRSRTPKRQKCQFYPFRKTFRYEFSHFTFVKDLSYVLKIK